MGLFDAVQRAFSPTTAPVVHPGAHGNQQSAQQPAPQPNPQDKFQQQNPGADPQNVPPNGQQQPDKDPIISQLDGFNDLWKTPAVDPKVVDPLTQPLLSYDPAKFAETARKMNFAQGLDPELVKKALGGDIESFMAAINHAAQNAFINSSQLSTNLVEGAAKTNNDRLTPKLQKQFKEFMLEQNRTNDPVMQHPAVAPMLDLAKRQLLTQHPNKTAEEIHQLAEQYVSSFAQVFNQNKDRTQVQKSNDTADPFDFSNYGLHPAS